MKNLELIVSDLDGTLVSNEVLSNKNDIDMIKSLQAQDFKIVPATGRSYSAAVTIAKELKIDDYTNLMICNNGALVTKVSEYDPILLKTVPLAQVNEMLTVSNKLGLCFYAYKVDQNVAYWNGVECPSVNLQKNNWVDSFEQIKIEDDINDEAIVQIMIFTPENLEKDFLNEISEIRKSMTGQKNDHEDVSFYEFNNIEASKGNAIKFIANHLKVSLEKTIAFGDNFNDISMFEVVGRSVAMDNASQAVKNKATDITGSVTEGGVSMYLNLLMMNMDEE
jgi:Cof subfamily protein (haloacid dehalogenase superfamily)